MLNEQERRGWLEAMKELKAQYYIGSQSAFRCLKEMRWYEQLRKDILQKNPYLKKRHDLPAIQLSCLVCSVVEVLESRLRMISVERSTPLNWLLLKWHRVLHPAHAVSFKREILPGGNVWTVDYSELLADFLQELRPYSSAKRTIHSFFSSIERRFRLGKFPLRSEPSGELVFYENICHNEKLRCEEGAEKLHPEDLVEKLKKSVQGFSFRLENDERDALTKACAAGDYSLVHAFWKRELLKVVGPAFRALSRDRLAARLERKSGDYERFLYDDDLYDRAESEYTLGYIETERRIVLIAVYEHPRGPKPEENPSDFVEEVIERCRDYVRQSKGVLDDAIADDESPDYLKFLTHKLKKQRYTYVALQQNRKWLIDFLSH